jgi:DNA topoisomerase-1
MKVSDFSVCRICDGICKKASVEFPEARLVAELFAKHGNLKLILDEKDSRFLRGGFCKGKVIGDRICFLPNGKKLNKAYSLFAPRLVVHDEKSNSHWDVIFQNPNGKFAYLYDLKKVKFSSDEKYKKVEKFDKCLTRLKRNLVRALDSDSMALPMLILLKTKMRVGNEIYYLKNRHKGLTTLKKRDIKISGDVVSFDYIGKDGVPQKLSEKFSTKVVKNLRKIMKGKKAGDFVFVDSNGHPLKDTHFEKAFVRYCGKEFYPHIVRSHYATKEAEKFLKKNRGASKKEVRKFCLKLADKLGHKKFSKKSRSWEDSYSVTLHHYIRPSLVEKFGL